jgi:hypothetical protein
MIGEDGTTTVHHPVPIELVGEGGSIQGMNIQPYDTVDSQSPLIINSMNNRSGTPWIIE